MLQIHKSKFRIIISNPYLFLVALIICMGLLLFFYSTNDRSYDDSVNIISASKYVPTTLNKDEYSFKNDEKDRIIIGELKGDKVKFNFMIFGFGTTNENGIITDCADTPIGDSVTRYCFPSCYYSYAQPADINKFFQPYSRSCGNEYDLGIPKYEVLGLSKDELLSKLQNKINTESKAYLVKPISDNFEVGEVEVVCFGCVISANSLESYQAIQEIKGEKINLKDITIETSIIDVKYSYYEKNQISHNLGNNLIGYSEITNSDGQVIGRLQSWMTIQE